MNPKKRIEILEAAANRERGGIFIVETDGKMQKADLDECLRIVQDTDFLQRHDVHITGGSGHLAELLDGLTEIETEE